MPREHPPEVHRPLRTKAYRPRHGQACRHVKVGRLLKLLHLRRPPIRKALSRQLSSHPRAKEAPPQLELIRRVFFTSDKPLEIVKERRQAPKEVHRQPRMKVCRPRHGQACRRVKVERRLKLLQLRLPPSQKTLSLLLSNRPRAGETLLHLLRSLPIEPRVQARKEVKATYLVVRLKLMTSRPSWSDRCRL